MTTIQCFISKFIPKTLRLVLVFASIGLTSSAWCQPKYGFTRFYPAEAQHGMVATASAPASIIGKNILKQGGNAVDAAVAIGFALAVTLPQAGNIGGGGFMLIWQNHKQHAIAIDYREKAPLGATPNMLLDKSNNVNYKVLSTSYLSSGVPGTVAGLVYAENHYGKLGLKRVMAPAISLAQHGFTVPASLAYYLKRYQSRLSRSKATRKVFFHANGQPYAEGETQMRPLLAKTLTLISEKGDRGFYEGDTAKKIAADNLRHGGLITLKDLHAYKVSVVSPITGTYHGYKIMAMPPPSSGGVILVEMLNMLKNAHLSPKDALSAKTDHILAEVMNLAYNDRNTHLGDPQFVTMPLKKLTSQAYANRLYHTINRVKHTPSAQISTLKATQESHQTTHFSVIDQDGNMVSNTYTLNFGFGNGQMIRGTGILMNNEMLDFTSKPGVANPFGLIESKANIIAPGKRPLSSMTPTFLINNNTHQLLATGSPGGSKIITTVMQFILNYVDFKTNIATATARPRIHSQLWPDALQYEPGISPDTLALLKHMGHHLKPSRTMGALETVARIKARFYGYSDNRRADGKAIGY